MRLKEYLERTEQSDNQFAVKAGFSRQLVGNWRRGKAIPSHRNQLKIRDFTGGLVGLDTW